MTTDPETGLVPVATTRQSGDLPNDLSRPRHTVGDWVGIATGGVLLVVTAAGLLYALVAP